MVELDKTQIDFGYKRIDINLSGFTVKYVSQQQQQTGLFNALRV